MVDNYIQLISRISESSGLTSEDIERRVEGKRAKLSGLVSKEGAAQIVAAELGINFEKERMKISELVQGMKRANILGKIIEIFPVREFNKNGREGKVASFVVADDSSNTRVVLWDTNHISLIEKGEINSGDIVEISNAGVRNGELHLSSFGDIKKSKEEITNVVTEKVFPSKKLKDAQVGQSVKTRAFIVQTFEPRYFEICPECRKRVVEGECSVHGKVQGVKRALLNIVLDDGTETMRAVIFGDNIKSLGLSDQEIFSLDNFLMKKESLLGEEKIFIGNLRANNLYNTTEFNIEGIEDVSADELIKELEAKAS